MKHAFVLIALAVALPVQGFGQDSNEPSFAAKERILGELRPGYAKGSIGFAGDGSRFAYVCGQQGRQQIILGNEVVGDTVVFCSVPQFSPVTNALHYVAINRDISGSYTVDLMADGKTIRVDFTPGAGTFVFSPDGRHYAALGGKVLKAGHTVKPGGVTVVVDGEVIGTYKDVSAPAFSDDGMKCAFLTLDHDETMSLLVNARPCRTFNKPQVSCSFIFNTSVAGPNLDGMAKLHIMPDGRFSFLTRDDRGWSVYLNEERVASYGLVVWGGPSGNVHTLVYDGSDAHSAIMANSFVAAENASTIAWWSRSGGKGTSWQVLVNGNPCDKYVWNNDIQRFPPRLSVDGRRVAYAATATSSNDSTEHYVVHDQKRYGPYHRVWALAMSADGSRVAFAASLPDQPESWHAYIDGEKVHEPFTSLYSTQFAPDASLVAWSAERDGKACAVIDGVSIASGDDILYGPAFASNAQPKWILQRGDELIEITAALE
ncbi:MAG: hypothetical protein ACXAB4_00415 [Candidatus Hodarchaeales archaeon]|jgi:hypothetical protein